SSRAATPRSGRGGDHAAPRGDGAVARHHRRRGPARPHRDRPALRPRARLHGGPQGSGDGGRRPGWPGGGLPRRKPRHGHRRKRRRPRRAPRRAPRPGDSPGRCRARRRSSARAGRRPRTPRPRNGGPGGLGPARGHPEDLGALESLNLHLRGADATRTLGERIAALLSPGDFVGLSGDLGAGKTTLVRSICEALGVPRERIASPTFAIVHPYEGGRLPVWHADLYRLGDEDELFETGFFELRESGGVLLVEWI